MMADQDPSQNEKITYICNNVNAMRKAHRIEVLNMIMCDESIDQSRICDKGAGVQLRISLLPSTLINTLYTYVHMKTMSPADA